MRSTIPALFFAAFKLAASLQAENLPPKSATPSELSSQAEQYAAHRAKSIIELQQFRHTSRSPIKTENGQNGSAQLINLNPEINRWFVLSIDWGAGRGAQRYHLENARPDDQRIMLDAAYPSGLTIASSGEEEHCALWSSPSAGSLAAAHASGQPYAPLCDGRVLLLNAIKGHQTKKEMVTDLLRNHFWKGEEVVTYVKDNFYEDAFRNSSIVESAKAEDLAGVKADADGPLEPAIDRTYQSKTVLAPALDIATENSAAPKFVIGKWYRAKNLAGVYVNVLEPRAISTELRRSLKDRTQPLDAVEIGALAYLVAFSLDDFDLGFALGTAHPGVGWSERASRDAKDASLPGPDGIDRVSPLINTGLISPAELPQVRAAFTGGFKRHHSAFKYGKLASQNNGSHYGFIENGVVLSKLQPELATLIVYSDGRVQMKTWREEYNTELSRIRHARQNGVPIIEPDRETGMPLPGGYVRTIGVGNWSGAEDRSLRTLRAGACLQEHEGRRFLIYGYFSSATPAAMAQVFQAAGCSYAMHLDMNALEHTYLAVYPDLPGGKAGHLMSGMQELEQQSQGQTVNRFVGYPDNRDFFYLMQKTPRLGPKPHQPPAHG